MNTLPISKGVFTWFMKNNDGSENKSLLDYGLIDQDKLASVTSFIIDSDARFACGSDHALLVATIKVGNKSSIEWSFKDCMRFRICSDTNYGKYRESLNKWCQDIPLHEFESISVEQQLEHLKRCLIGSATDGIGLSTFKKRPRKLPRTLVQLIREKNKLAREVSNDESDEDKSRELSLLRQDI